MGSGPGGDECNHISFLLGFLNEAVHITML